MSLSSYPPRNQSISHWGAGTRKSLKGARLIPHFDRLGNGTFLGGVLISRLDGHGGVLVTWLDRLGVATCGFAAQHA